MADTDLKACRSRGGLNASCPDGCRCDPNTDELNGTRYYGGVYPTLDQNFRTMQDGCASYLSSARYRERADPDHVVEVSGPARYAAVILDMIYMLDGPEQRAAPSTGPAREAVAWTPQIGEEVRVSEDTANRWLNWREVHMWVVGVSMEGNATGAPSEGLNVCVSDEWPVTNRTGGFTDGFYLNRAYASDDLQPLYTTPQSELAGEPVAWMPNESMDLWVVGAVSDGEHACVAQKAGADYGGLYFADDREDALEWEPTEWRLLTGAALQPAPATGGADDKGRCDAWNDFFSDHLTDGGDGHRAVRIIARCRSAVDEAWRGGRAPAIRAALSALTAPIAPAENERAKIVEECAKVADRSWSCRAAEASMSDDGASISARDEAMDFNQAIRALSTNGGG